MFLRTVGKRSIWADSSLLAEPVRFGLMKVASPTPMIPSDRPA